MPALSLIFTYLWCLFRILRYIKWTSSTWLCQSHTDTFNICQRCICICSSVNRCQVIRRHNVDTLYQLIKFCSVLGIVLVSHFHCFLRTCYFCLIYRYKWELPNLKLKLVEFINIVTVNALMPTTPDHLVYILSLFKTNFTIIIVMFLMCVLLCLYAIAMFLMYFITVLCQKWQQ